MNIIIIEDNQLISDVIKIKLKHILNNDLQIHCFSTLKQTMKYLEGDRADLLILDLNLPDSREEETLKVCMEHFTSTPLIFISGSEEIRFKKKSLDKPNWAFVEKNNNFNDYFEKKIKTLLPTY